MRNLKKAYLKNYCGNCEEITELRKKISELNLKNKELSEEVGVLRKLLKFNNQKENIVYINRHNAAMFAITSEVKYNFRGKLTEIEFKGYDLKIHGERLVKSDSFIHLRSDVVYDDEYDCLNNLFIYDFKSHITMRDFGFGTIMLQKFIEYAKTLDILYISGSLSWIDIGNEKECTEEQLNNRERLYHFYSKHKFNIDERSNIRLQLK